MSTRGQSAQKPISAAKKMLLLGGYFASIRDKEGQRRYMEKPSIRDKGQRRYMEKLSIIGGFDPYESERNEWQDDVVSRSQTLYLPLPEIRVWWTEQGKLVFTPQDKRGYLSPPLSVCGWSLCKRCK